MYISHEFKAYMENRGGHDIYKYKIIDSDFETHIFVINNAVETAIIQEYEKRNLNVVANLIRAVIFAITKQKETIDLIIRWNEEYPEFQKYKQDLEKYICLI